MGANQTNLELVGVEEPEAHDEDELFHGEGVVQQLDLGSVVHLFSPRRGHSASSVVPLGAERIAGSSRRIPGRDWARVRVLRAIRPLCRARQKAATRTNTIATPMR